MIRHSDFLGLLQKSHAYDRYIVGLCPFHDDGDPSLMVWPDGWFNCLGCNRHGSWKQLYNKLKGQDIILRPETRRSWNGPVIHGSLEDITYQAHIDLTNFSSLGWYIEERGLSNRIEINEIGYHEGWYTFPVLDKDGNFVTTVFRSTPVVQQASGIRYYVKHDRLPYVPDWRRVEKGDYILVCYGIMDALTLADLGYPVMTGTSGKTFNYEWLETYRKAIYIIPDKHEEEDAYELARNLQFRGRVINLEYPDGYKDCNDFYHKRKGEVLRHQLENAIR